MSTLAATADTTEPPARRSRPRWMLPALFLLAVVLVLGRGVLAGEEEPSTMLGATGSVPGGLARLNGVMPYTEFAAQKQREAPPEFGDAAPSGSHRVIVLLELTAVEPSGIEFDASDYAVDRLGGRHSSVVWASPAEASVAQGKTVQAELIFEVPDKALELTLEGAGDVRLSMGTDHHSGAGGR